eukprot:CAMPEP_0184482138 /NCGR_PEP_ID=MMETSP0113_2-20130426/3709_1 /TAXON_ID=91329 /ORGANISM="Norrisiella sphaerica, Strain BC52" /LENGTH=144 /DNA_ID=CAMNT_0026861703 /DNA_START=77 /DNA_END=512 /DNA_ORIENTATION=+
MSGGGEAARQISAQRSNYVWHCPYSPASGLPMDAAGAARAVGFDGHIAPLDTTEATCLPHEVLEFLEIKRPGLKLYVVVTAAFNPPRLQLPSRVFIQPLPVLDPNLLIVRAMYDKYWRSAVPYGVDVREDIEPIGGLHVWSNYP